MGRTTSDLIDDIIEVDSAILLAPFIAAANAIVTKCCTNLTEDYEAEHLIIIETWLAAHFYTVRDMRAEMEKAGSVSERKQSKVDLGFATSHYGQMAMTLDWFGGLSTLNKDIITGANRTVGVTWLGTEDE